MSDANTPETTEPAVEPAQGVVADVAPGVLYRRLLGYVLPYKWVFIAAIIGMVVTAAADTGFTALLKPIMDRGLVAHDAEFTRLIPFLLVGVFFVRGVAEFINNYCINWVGRRVIFDLRRQMFSRLINAPARFYDANSSATLVSKLIYDVEQVAEASTSAVRVVVKDALTVIALFMWMCWLNWRLTMILIVLAPAIAIVIRVASRRFRTSSTGVQHSMGGIADVAKEAFQGQRVVKVFGGHEHEERLFDRANNTNRQRAMKKVAVASASVPMVLMVVGIGVAFIIHSAVQQSGSGNVSAGAFVSYLGALILMMSPIKRLARINEVIQTGVAAASSVFSVIDTDSEVDTGTQQLAQVEGNIRFRGLDFEYLADDAAPVAEPQPDGDSPHVLHDIDLEIRSGQTVALVGPSGSGKTTLVSLLLRLYPHRDGEISLDDVPIQDIGLRSYRTAFSIVSQDTVLFDDTIRANIAYGCRYGEKDDAPVDDSAVLQAAEAANIMEFVERLPDGLNTMVGEQGVRLSGGQRQRVAIARALYKNAPILVLDEATSSLDSQSERLVQDATRRLVEGRTTLIIAHRLSTIEHADQIVVLERGRIVEKGTHAELLASESLYARLHRAQTEPAKLAS